MKKIKITPTENDLLEVCKPIFLLMGIGACSVSSDDSESPLNFSAENAALFNVDDKYNESPLLGETYEEIIADLFPIIKKYGTKLMGSVDQLSEGGEVKLTLSLNQGEFELQCYFDADTTEEDGRDYAIDDLIGAAGDPDWLKMKDLLEGNGIASVCMEFSGGGDSGGVYDVSYEPIKQGFPTEAQKFIESHLEGWAYDQLNIDFNGNIGVSGKISVYKEEGDHCYSVSCSKSESYLSSDSETAVLKGPRKKQSGSKKGNPTIIKCVKNHL